MLDRRRFLVSIAAAAAAYPLRTASAAGAPVLFGLDAEFGHVTSTSAPAIRQGMLVAMHEINAAGGVLGGRPLTLVERDNRSVPARGIANVRELAAIPDLVGVFCGKFSPVVIETIPVAHERELILCDPWAAADEIVDNGRKPNYVFRLSLRDSWAIPTIIDYAKRRGFTRLGALLPNTAWGRGNQVAIESHARANPWLGLVGMGWYNWGDSSLAQKYLDLTRAGAQAILLVANETEASILVKEMAAMPAADRVPLLSHWGMSGGDFLAMCGDALKSVDMAVVQTVTLAGRSDPRLLGVMRSARDALGIGAASEIKSQVGFAHAYDLTHILARAVDKAGTTHRPTVRDAMEALGPFDGLVMSYAEPFTATRHEALRPDLLFMGRFGVDGITPVAD
ncbi:MAG: ABC transporter substrate-binding protein [Alphaproteobacteria bacterium]|nr:ABC transporter substrate-binding protein [Alphaproteobacteria bacterium]